MLNIQHDVKNDELQKVTELVWATVTKEFISMRTFKD